MQTRHRVALLTAGLLVGAQIGVASMGTPSTDASESPEPAANEALAPDAGLPGELAEATTESAGSTPTDITAADGSGMPDRIQPAIPQGTAFPSQGPDPDWPMLPSLIAYLDQTAHLRVTGASGNVFPPSTDDAPMLPTLAAYLEQRHTAVVAEYSAPQPTALTATDTAPAAAGEANAAIPVDNQEATREVSLLDRILPQGLRNLF